MRSFLTALILLGSASILSAATVPYSQGFGSGGGGDPTPAEFTETNTTHWTLQPPLVGGEYQNFMSVSGSMFSLVSLTTSSGLPFPTLPGNSFSMSTGFMLDTLAVTGSTESRAFAGFAVLAADANYAATGSPHYQLLYVLDGAGSQVTGSLYLSSFNAPGSTILASSAGTLPVALGVPYTLTITGNYSGGGLMLSGNLSSSAGSISVADSETGPVLAGTHFGFLGNVVATGASSVSTLDIDYDYLTVESALASADFDSDGDVDGEDFLAWQCGLGMGSGADREDGDADGDHDVDGDDLAKWREEFGDPAMVSTLTGYGLGVPEPSTAMLLLVGCAAAATLARCDLSR